MKFSVVVKKIVVVCVEAESAAVLSEALEDEKRNEALLDYVDTLDDDSDADESAWDTELELRRGVKDVPVELRLAKGKFSVVVDDEEEKEET